ncbi:MAG: hypothetical protein ABIR70_10805 [Bryobacteraceae bacterium]
MACTLLLMGASLTTSGCLFGGPKKKAKVFVPPPVYSTAPAPPVNPKPVVLTPPLENEPVVNTGVEPIAVGTNLPPAPAKPTPPPKTTPVKPPPTVVEITPPPVAPAPKPATIFSAAERQQLNDELEQRLGKVRAALARVEGKTNLTADQAALANNARTQMMNAEQVRGQDLVTAVSLAKRAESFATELVQHLP